MTFEQRKQLISSEDLSQFYDYISPVQLEYTRRLKEKTDDSIQYAIELQLGVKVDREELIKAMNYDREQYKKGFADGYNARDKEKHGEWQGTVCSICGASVSDYYDCYFCPKCGANMQDKPHWINHTEYGVTTYITDKDVECSECGHRQPKLFDMNFCPNCGAEMRERRDSE